jgi:hypothetical protein
VCEAGIFDNFFFQSVFETGGSFNAIAFEIEISH